MIKKTAERTGLALVLAASSLPPPVATRARLKRRVRSRPENRPGGRNCQKERGGLRRASREESSGSRRGHPGTIEVLQEAERKSDESAGAVEESSKDARRVTESAPDKLREHSKP